MLKFKKDGYARHDSLEKYEAQLLIFAAQCCFIWYQIEIFESAMRKK